MRVALRAGALRRLSRGLLGGAGVTVLAGGSPRARAPQSTPAPVQPVIDYVLHVDPADTTGFDVAMHVRNAPDTFRVAMVAHPEYDDRYWRHVIHLRAASPGGTAAIARIGDALWQVTTAGDVTLTYRLALPPTDGATRAAYRPFVSTTGALVGGVHTFMYVVGASHAPSHIRLDLPAGWDVATGLEATVDRRVFFASDVWTLTESPILAGRLRTWTFTVAGVPHRIAYWPAPGALPFDTTTFVDGIARIARQTLALFGHAPFRDYTFLLQDDARGSLEHPNSVTIGVSSAGLAHDPAQAFGEIAHEYFHAWNIMRLHPPGYGRVSRTTPPRSAELWWSEGATMFYADLILRRGGLAPDGSTRVAHLAAALGRYYTTSGNHLLSPERVSRAEYGPRGDQLGDNTASTHLQGELLTTALDLVIREATGGRRSMDDVMRAMLADHAGPPGFTSDDVEAEVARICGCSVRRFFLDHVHGPAPLEFNRYLRPIGLAFRVDWEPAVDARGVPLPDRRLYAWQPRGEPGLRLMVLDTMSVWERAGLHTGDRLVAVNGAAMADPAALWSIIRSLRIGDTLRIAVRRADGIHRVDVTETGYHRARVTIDEVPDATPAQRALRNSWLRGTAGSEERR
jgi:predicted metalloprotease with PDZ domain